MPEILPYDAPFPNAVLGWDGTAYRVFTVDAAGQLQIDVVASGLPAGAATAANQAIIAGNQGTMITALQLLDNLYNALHSVNTDELVVRGEDQLFSYLGNLRDYTLAAISGAGGYIDSGVVPVGEIWVITTVVAHDATSPTTRHRGATFEPAQAVLFYTQLQAFAAGDWSDPTGRFQC